MFISSEVVVDELRLFPQRWWWMNCVYFVIGGGGVKCVS